MQVILVKYPTRVHCTTSTVLHCTALHNELKSEGLPVSDSATSARASQNQQQIYFLLAKNHLKYPSISYLANIYILLAKIIPLLYLSMAISCQYIYFLKS